MPGDTWTNGDENLEKDWDEKFVAAKERVANARRKFDIARTEDETAYAEYLRTQQVKRAAETGLREAQACVETMLDVARRLHGRPERCGG